MHTNLQSVMGTIVQGIAQRTLKSDLILFVSAYGFGVKTYPVQQNG